MVLALPCDFAKPHDHPPSHNPAKFCDHKHHGSGDIMVLVLSCDLVKPYDHPPSHTPATFCGHRHHVRGDIVVLVCHVISQGHMTKGSSNIMNRSPSSLSTSCQVWWP